MSVALLREDAEAAIAQYADGLHWLMPPGPLNDAGSLLDSHRDYALDLLNDGTISAAEMADSLWNLAARMVAMRAAANV
ncbi:hypothetical protein [Streptomyces roseolilacinus]|uniref:hypothetical protein n=1 Tax=Streptomyces roseolilacinus TaxID=66904 RepID=UPI0038282205